MPLLAAARQAASISGIKDRAARSLRDFVMLMDELAALQRRPRRGGHAALLSLSAYRDLLAGDSKGGGEDRLANVDELVSAARQFDVEHPGGERPRLPGTDQPDLGRRPLGGRRPAPSR